MASPDAVQVLVVASAEDEHARVVLQSLATLGAHALRFNLDDIRTVRQLAEAGSLKLLSDGQWTGVDGRTTVWWRRAGIVAVGDLDPLEARLVEEECVELLRGGLLATRARFVDDPFVIARAETKEYQLSVATGLGVRVPATLITNHLDQARGFASRRRTLAKAVSSGEGIAPFVDECDLEDLTHVEVAPVLLQELVRCERRPDRSLARVGACRTATSS